MSGKTTASESAPHSAGVTGQQEAVVAHPGGAETWRPLYDKYCPPGFQLQWNGGTGAGSLRLRPGKPAPPRLGYEDFMAARFQVPDDGKQRWLVGFDAAGPVIEDSEGKREPVVHMPRPRLHGDEKRYSLCSQDVQAGEREHVLETDPSKVTCVWCLDAMAGRGREAEKRARKLRAQGKARFP